VTPTDGTPEASDTTGKLPDAVIIGAAKSATTSLFHRLIRHPQIFQGPAEDVDGVPVARSKDKELCFFSDDPIYAKGMPWYRSHFAAAEPGQLCMEASTNYTRWPQLPDTAERMAKHVPDARLIYIVRHPVDRAYSHYVHRYTRELHPGEPVLSSFEEHIKLDPMCIDSSLYMQQLERFLEYYPRSAIHVFLTSDLKREPEVTMRELCRFLDIDPDGIQLDTQSVRQSNNAKAILEGKARGAITAPFSRMPVIGPLARRLPKSWKDKVYNLLKRTKHGRTTSQSLTPPPMSPEARAKFLRFFEAPNRELAQFLGRDLSEWSK
jgi:hypothetical protein